MPWLGAILIAGAAALGRLVAVQLLPAAVVVVIVWLTVRAHAFDGGTAGLHWNSLMADFRPDTGATLLFVLVVFVSAVLLQPFEVAAVRLLEGYWRSNRVVDGVARLFVAWHRYRLRGAMRVVSAVDDIQLASLDGRGSGVDDLPSVPVQAKLRNGERKLMLRVERARHLRKRYPPSEEQLLPTMLGNTLRAAERRAGERYYLPTVHALPRLYQYLSDRLGSAYDAAVDTLDAAARMAISSAVACLVAVVAFLDDPNLWWVPGVLAVLSFLSYRGAVTAAMQYGLFMDIAFDVHRFDLLKALHLDLPADVAEEKEIGKKLQQFFAAADAEEARLLWWHAKVRYWHYEEHARPTESSGSQDGK